MQQDVQKVLSALVRRGSIRAEDAVACVREAQATGEHPLAVAVRRGLLPREEASRALAEATRVDGEEALSVSPPPAGKVAKVFGPYEILRQLGEGGMGVVYEARDSRLGRNVALKVLHADRPVSRSTLARFEQEARAAAKLNHPNVCPVFDVGELGGVPFYTMELVPGVSVAALAAGRAHWRRVCEVIRDAARGLQHAHEQGIVHRDVKPSNILIDEEGRGRLVDFGLATDSALEERPDRLTRTGQFMGTPYYLAPECIEKGSKTATPLSDIYSLGVTLHEAITGDLPFKAATTFALFQDVLGGDVKAPQLPAGTPHDVAIVILRALARDPARRYPTAQELALDLDRVLRGEPVAGRPPTLPEMVRTISRRPGFLAGVAALVAVSGLLAVVGIRFVAPGAAPAPPSLAPPPPPPAPQAAVPASPAAPPAASAETSGALLAKARSVLWTGDVESARALYRRALEADRKNADACLEEVLAGYLVHDQAAGGGESVAELTLAKKDGALAFVVAETALVPKLKADVEGAAPEDVEVDVADSAVAALIRAARARRFLELAEERVEDSELLAKAETLVRDALRERPRCGLFATVLADVLLHTGRAAPALELLDEDRDYEGVARSLRDYTRGVGLVLLEKPIDAEAVLKKVTASPWDVLARGVRAAAWLRKGDPAAVVAVFDGHDPGSVADWFCYARCLAALDRPSDARHAIDAAIELSEQGGDALALCRAAKRSAKDTEKALEARKRAESLVLGAADARGWRARRAARSGDVARATDDARKLAEAPGLDALERAGGVDASPVRKLRRIEENATRACMAVAQNDMVTAKRFLAAVLDDATVEDLPADFQLDRARILAAGGDREGALAACKQAASADPTLEAASKKLIAELAGGR